MVLSGSSIDDVLCKIRALHATNTRIIQRLLFCPSAITTWYSYDESWDEDSTTLKVVERAHRVSTTTILQQWSTENDMELDLLRTSSLGTAGRSLPEWSAPTLTWSSMNRMNSQMIREVENLSKLLDPSPDNQGPEAEFRKYLRNYEKLQAALEDLEETTKGKPSRLTELQAAATSINEARLSLKTKMLQTPKVALYLESIIVGEEESFIQNLMEWYCPSGAWMRLLYRGTRDGMEPATFHRLCDDQGPTITIIKSTNGLIFGGNTTASWSGNGAKTCDKTSLFTLTKPQEDLPMKFDCIPKFRSQAIIADPNRGPAFSGNELAIAGGIGEWNKNNRFKAVGPHPLVGQSFGLPVQSRFAVADIEVFAVS